MSQYCRVTIYLEHEQLMRLREIARRKGCSVSELVRKFIREGLSSEMSRSAESVPTNSERISEIRLQFEAQLPVLPRDSLAEAIKVPDEVFARWHGKILKVVLGVISSRTRATLDILNMSRHNPTRPSLITG